MKKGSFYVLFIVVLLLLHTPLFSQVKQNELYQPECVKWRIVKEMIYGVNAYILTTTDTVMIDTVISLFDLNRIKAVRNAYRVDVIIFHHIDGLGEKDLILFKDEYNNTLFGIIIALGQLKAAYKLQDLMIEPVIKQDSREKK